MNIYKKLNVIGFLFLIAAPSILWFFISPNIADASNSENRRLKQFPVFNSLTMKEFPREFEGYYQDNLPFRSFFITLYRITQYSLFKDIESNQIIISDKGWLFYKDINDGDPLADYKRINLFTEEELKKITENLTVLKRYLESRNCEFILTICPNKENMYSEYMPKAIIRKKGISRTDQLIDYLTKHTDINIIYPYQDLQNAKKTDVLYYKIDTHWNAAGAYITAQKILELQGIKIKRLEELGIQYEKRTGEIEKAGYDLARITGIEHIFTEPYEYVLKGIEKTEIKPVPSATNELRYTAPKPRLGKLMMVRDSFTNLMIPILSPYYEESVYIIYHDFKQEMIDEEKPDVFIYEAVERYIPALLKYNFN